MSSSVTSKLSSINKILLLEHSTKDELPDHIVTILNSMDVQRLTQFDILSILIYCIGLEMGFASSGILDSSSDQLELFWGYSFHKKNISILSNIVSQDKTFRSEVETGFTYRLKLITYSDIECILLTLQTGEIMIVTLVPHQLPGKSICLSIPRYVLPTKKKNIASKLQNLNELSFQLKDSVFVPIRNVLMDESKSLYPGLCGVPPEILNLILKNLNVKDIQNLSKTCWKLRQQCSTYYEMLKISKRIT